MILDFIASLSVIMGWILLTDNYYFPCGNTSVIAGLVSFEVFIWALIVVFDTSIGVKILCIVAMFSAGIELQRNEDYRLKAKLT